VSTQWLDFRGIKAQVPIRAVLERYGFLDGLTDKKSGKLVGPCPIHGGTGKASFHVDTAKNIWKCFSTCNSGGNVLDLVMRVDNCTIREAGERLARWFGLTFDKDEKAGKESANLSQELRPDVAAAHTSRLPDDPVVNPTLERPLQNLNQDHPYLLERGLTPPTIEHFGVGHCTRGLMRGRIAIPIHNESGELVAYAGRAVDEELATEKGKYRLPANFAKAHVVWNLDRAKVHGDDGIIVVEGFFGAMKVHQAGFPNVVALMGCSLSDRQEELLVGHTHRLALMFDGDDAGVRCLRDFYGRLRRRLYLREVHLEAGEQPDELPEERLRALLA